MLPPIVIGSSEGVQIYPVEVYHKLCGKCQRPVEVIKYGDVKPLREETVVLCTVCLANHYIN